MKVKTMNLVLYMLVLSGILETQVPRKRVNIQSGAQVREVQDGIQSLPLIFLGRMNFHFIVVSLFLVVQLTENLKSNKHEDSTSNYSFVTNYG